MLGIPGEIITSAARAVSSGSILLGKSPKLAVLLYGVIVLQGIASQKFADFLNWLSSKFGLDKPLVRTTQSNDEWDIDQVLDNFEDMRVNAKEVDILKGIKTKDHLERCGDRVHG
jgi:hypothetical protein